MVVLVCSTAGRRRRPAALLLLLLPVLCFALAPLVAADSSIATTSPLAAASPLEQDQELQQVHDSDHANDEGRQGQHERLRKSEAFNAEEALTTPPAGGDDPKHQQQQQEQQEPSFPSNQDINPTEELWHRGLRNFDELLAEVMLKAEEGGHIYSYSSLFAEENDQVEALKHTDAAAAAQDLNNEKNMIDTSMASSVDATSAAGEASLDLDHDAHHRALSHKKKGGSEAYYPDGNLLPAAAAIGGGGGFGSPYAVPGGLGGLGGVGGVGGIGAILGVGLAPSVRPGITLGVGRFRDSIDARNRKVKRGGHALCTNVRFTPPLSFPAGGVGPSDIEIGDLNGDCIKDLVVAASGSDVIVVFLGCGDGTFFPGVRYPVGLPGSFPYRIRLADVNGDKRLDIVTANLGGGTLSVLLGRGDGTFTNGFVFPTGGGGPVGLALGDFNGDGILDVALALAKCESLTILWGDGLGSFVRPLNIAMGSLHDCGFPLSILAADLNLDGFADLVIGTSAVGRNLAVLTSLGDGTFRRPILHELGHHTKPVALAMGFFNCDLFPDVVTVNGGLDNSISVLLGRGDGSFRKPRSFSVSPGVGPMALAVGDFNGDLIPDIVTANALSNDVTILRGTLVGWGGRGVKVYVGRSPGWEAESFAGQGGRRGGFINLCALPRGKWVIFIFLCTKTGVSTYSYSLLSYPKTPNTGHGDGTFSRMRTFPVEGVGIPGPAAVAVGLLNKDIKHDIAVAHFSGNLVSVLLNTCTKEHFHH